MTNSPIFIEGISLSILATALQQQADPSPVSSFISAAISVVLFWSLYLGIRLLRVKHKTRKQHRIAGAK